MILCHTVCEWLHDHTLPVVIMCVYLLPTAPYPPASFPKWCVLYRKGCFCWPYRRYLMKVPVLMNGFSSLILLKKMVSCVFNSVWLNKVFTRSWKWRVARVVSGRTGITWLACVLFHIIRVLDRLWVGGVYVWFFSSEYNPEAMHCSFLNSTISLP